MTGLLFVVLLTVFLLIIYLKHLQLLFNLIHSSSAATSFSDQQYRLLKAPRLKRGKAVQSKLGSTCDVSLTNPCPDSKLECKQLPFSTTGPTYCLPAKSPTHKCTKERGGEWVLEYNTTFSDYSLLCNCTRPDIFTTSKSGRSDCNNVTACNEIIPGTDTSIETLKCKCQYPEEFVPFVNGGPTCRKLNFRESSYDPPEYVNIPKLSKDLIDSNYLKLFKQSHLRSFPDPCRINAINGEILAADVASAVRGDDGVVHCQVNPSYADLFLAIKFNSDYLSNNNGVQPNAVCGYRKRQTLLQESLKIPMHTWGYEYVPGPLKNGDGHMIKFYLFEYESLDETLQYIINKARTNIRSYIKIFDTENPIKPLMPVNNQYIMESLPQIYIAYDASSRNLYGIYTGHLPLIHHFDQLDTLVDSYYVSSSHHFNYAHETLTSSSGSPMGAIPIVHRTTKTIDGIVRLVTKVPYDVDQKNVNVSFELEQAVNTPPEADIFKDYMSRSLLKYDTKTTRLKLNADTNQTLTNQFLNVKIPNSIDNKHVLVPLYTDGLTRNVLKDIWPKPSEEEKKRSVKQILLKYDGSMSLPIDRLIDLPINKFATPFIGTVEGLHPAWSDFFIPMQIKSKDLKISGQVFDIPHFAKKNF